MAIYVLVPIHPILDDDLPDGLYLPLNEPMASGVVKPAGSQLEPTLCCNILAFMCHKLLFNVRDDLFHITIL